jgi:hypothetical protein
MKTRPILFNGAMVRALLDGSKTQTRRIVKPQLYEGGRSEHWSLSEYGQFCPYGQSGGRLWVRETWQGPLLTDGDEFEAYRESPDDFKKPAYCEYAADGGPKPEFMTDDDDLVCRWRPSIHMPRWASRITLEIVSVRVERLQAISESDALAEGVDLDSVASFARVAGVTRPVGFAYRDLWESINGDGSWDANPWVWVVEFKKVTSC